MESGSPMSSQPQWLARLVDATTMENLVYLNRARSRVFNPVYNRPGSFTAQVDIDSEPAMLVEEHSTAIMLERNGEAVWSGPVFSTTDSADGSNDVTNITAMGWFEEINHRYLWAQDEPDAVFTDNTKTGGEISFELLRFLINRTLSDGSPAPIRLRPGASTDTQVRSRSYKRGQNIGAAVTELIDIENGMDIDVDPILRTLNTRPPTSFVDQDKVHFGYKTAPNNVAAIGRQKDGMKTVNSYVSTGNNGIYIEGIDDPEVIGEQGVVLEGQISLSDVGDRTIVTAYSVAELEFFKRGGITLSVTPKSLPGGKNIFRLYDDFFLGDQVYFSCDRGRVQYSRQPMRVFGATISIDDEGNENLSELQITVA